MSKRILLSTVFFAVPLALAGCSNNDGQVSGSMEATEFSAASTGAHELGVIHFQAGNFGLAIQHFQTATARDPRSVESWNGLAAGYDKVGRFDLAERYYKRALVIVDAPSNWNSVDTAAQQISNFRSDVSASNRAALFFPRIKMRVNLMTCCSMTSCSTISRD